MNRKKLRPKGGETPSGLNKEETSSNIITLRLLMYNSDRNLIAECILGFNSILELATQRILKGKDVQDFLGNLKITEEILEVAIYV